MIEVSGFTLKPVLHFELALYKLCSPRALLEKGQPFPGNHNVPLVTVGWCKWEASAPSVIHLLSEFIFKKLRMKNSLTDTKPEPSNTTATKGGTQKWINQSREHVRARSKLHLSVSHVATIRCRVLVLSTGKQRPFSPHTIHKMVSNRHRAKQEWQLQQTFWTERKTACSLMQKNNGFWNGATEDANQTFHRVIKKKKNWQPKDEN